MQYREEDYDEMDAVRKETAEDEKVVREEKEAAKKENTGNKKSAFKSILSTIEWLLLAVSFGLVVYAFVCTARGKAVTVAGYSLLHVITGSMEPTISTGDYVIVKKEETSALKVGDIVAYYTKDPQIYGRPVIHRIHEIKDDGTFVTWGDANPVPDPLAVYQEQILGRYTRRSFLFNWLSSFSDPRKLLLLMVSVPIFLISIYEAGTLAKLIKIKRSMVPGAKSKRREEEIEKLKKQAIEEYLAGAGKEEITGLAPATEETIVETISGNTEDEQETEEKG